MFRYDPAVQPDSADWLGQDELTRIAAVEAYHRRARIRLPNARVHAAIHAIVENQLALGMEAVANAIPRLMREGLSAIHAVGTQVAALLFRAGTRGLEAAANINADYIAAVERLSAREWLASGDEHDR